MGSLEEFEGRAGGGSSIAVAVSLLDQENLRYTSDGTCVIPIVKTRFSKRITLREMTCSWDNKQDGNSSKSEPKCVYLEMCYSEIHTKIRCRLFSLSLSTII